MSYLARGPRRGIDSKANAFGLPLLEAVTRPTAYAREGAK